MRFDCRYEVVVEFDYPLGVSSDLAYDTWGRDIRKKVHDRLGTGVRVVRSHNHLKISVLVPFYASLGGVIETLLATVMPQAPEDIALKIHELEREETPAQQAEFL